MKKSQAVHEAHQWWRGVSIPIRLGLGIMGNVMGSCTLDTAICLPGTKIMKLVVIGEW